MKPPNKPILWKGQAIEMLSHQELLEAFYEMAQLYRAEQECHDRDVEFTVDLMKAGRPEGTTD